MPLHFNPADVQATGIGLAAFLSTLLATFVFLSARHEKLGRPLLTMLLASVVWSSFGFLYHIIPDIGVARAMRVISVMGIVWMSMAHVHFSYIYFEERGSLPQWGKTVRMLAQSCGTVLSLFLALDLFGGHFIVGALMQPTNLVLAPNAGPLMAWLILYYGISIGISGVLLAASARLAEKGAERRQIEWLFASLVVGLFLGGTRFTPWYGFDFYPLVGSVGYPLFVFAAFYSIKRYHLLNLQVAAAQLLIFALWTFTFFRALLDQSLNAAIPDASLFIAVLVLGVLLLRSIIMEGKAQRELAALTIDRAKSEFVTIAAHQLRTPLSALRWAFSLLLTDSTAPLTHEQREIAQKGARAADNMMALADDLLNVARISDRRFKFDIEPGDVRDAVRVAAGLLEEPAQRRKVRLTLDLPESVPTVEYDRGKLAFALENLIDNAIKYTPEGGEVRVGVSSAGGNVVLSVHDTGIGIPAADQSRLFERFFRGKGAVRMSPDGSGLGLFIAKTIVEGHGGSIALTSQEGHGTTVAITLRASTQGKA